MTNTTFNQIRDLIKANGVLEPEWRFNQAGQEYRTMIVNLEVEGLSITFDPECNHTALAFISVYGPPFMSLVASFCEDPTQPKYGEDQHTEEEILEILRRNFNTTN